jgi:hypothetical protein
MDDQSDKKDPFCRYFASSTRFSTPVDSLPSAAFGDNGARQDAALSTAHRAAALVDKSVAGDLIYTDAPRPHVAAHDLPTERAHL